ncbi:MAG: hypothetical protein M3041_02555 [Acidobacteriota bacterium]|nr:hypothetical protein [Acidobacteriota bacterium]
MRGRLICSAIVIAAFVPFLSLAAEDAQVSGKFQGSKSNFDVGGGYAYWINDPDDGPLIEVAVSNSSFKRSYFDAFYNPRPAIDTQFVDDQTAVVYFQFEPNGKYHGLSYYLGSGDGCGFCYDPKAKSTVRIAGQRAKGTLSFQGDNRAFDITMDVPIAPKEWGKPIDKDGSEVAKVFRAYNAAVDKGDQKAVFKLLDSETRDIWTKQEKKGKLDAYLDYRAEKVHWRLKDARIVSGYVRDNQAVLVIKASSPLIDHLHGQVLLTKEGDGWKIADEVYQVGE